MAVWNMPAVYDGRLSAPPPRVPPTISGLTVYLDAGDSDSYPGTGSTWYDLSGLNNNMTLSGGPTYLPSINGGVFQFTTSQYAASTLNYSTSTYTIMAGSRYSPGAATKRRIVGAQSNNWMLGHYNGGYTEAYYAEGWVATLNATGDSTWRIYTGTENYASDQRSFYVNNVARVTNSTAGSAGFNGLSVNKDPYSESSDCQVSFIVVYNRILTSAEMTQIFSYFKGRLGIA